VTEVRQVGSATGVHRDYRSSERSRRWWGVTSLASAVAATSILVPPLVSARPSKPLRDSRAAASSVTASGPVVAGGGSGAPSVAATAVLTGTTAPVFPTVRVAAADPDNERFGVAVTACATCASGSRVQYLGQGHALVVHVRDLPVAGRRTLTIVYETRGTRPLDLIVNGGKMISLNLPGKESWTTPAEISLTTDLPAGDTVIRFFQNSSPAPDLDQIVIT
jgi:hypothetical protein